jgi:flagellar hook-associated protein 1 FlgK
VSDGSAFTADSGSLGALTTLINQTLPDLRAQLDEFTASFVREVNLIHREGTTQSGRTGVDFFDPNGSTAGTIALSADVVGSIGEIAAGSSADPGDNTIALRIADLAYQRLDSLGGVTLRDRYLSFAASVASSTRSAIDDATVQESLAVQADIARQAVSGVSVDEEMVNLVSQQEAYSAAARLIQVSMEMMDAILRI